MGCGIITSSIIILSWWLFPSSLIPASIACDTFPLAHQHLRLLSMETAHHEPGRAENAQRVEATLLEGEDRLREALALAHVGSFFWKIADNRVSWSEELYRIYGLDPATFQATF